MTTVFIGGSRRISRLNDTIRSRADDIMHQNFAVIIGDANGTDKSMQSYFASNGYRNVVVYCMEGQFRNNIGHWPTRQIYSHRQEKDFSYYATKDREMAKAASYGFMIWDGKSKGTFNNVLNLLRQQKEVLVYFLLDESCQTLKSHEDLAALLGKCSSNDRRKFEREFPQIVFSGTELQNLDLFSAHR